MSNCPRCPTGWRPSWASRSSFGPQLLINVRVREKPDLRAHPTIGPAVTATEEALAGSGRVVLRYSGTEPLVRVMLEGKNADQVRQEAERLAGVIEDELGV